MDRSVAFYQDVLGLALEKRFTMANGSELAFLRVGDCTIELICRPGGNVPSAPGQVDHICFDVCDIEPLVERLRAQGVSFLSESVSTMQGGHCGHQKHFPHRPDGERIEFFDQSGAKA